MLKLEGVRGIVGRTRNKQMTSRHDNNILYCLNPQTFNRLRSWRDGEWWLKRRGMEREGRGRELKEESNGNGKWTWEVQEKGIGSGMDWKNPGDVEVEKGE